MQARGPHVRLRAVVLMVVSLGLAAPAAAEAAPRPADDPFYAYTGTTPLDEIAPGTVLKTRTSRYHVAGIRSSIEAVQILYRSTGQLGESTTNVTSVLLPPPSRRRTPKLIAYQSFYDSLNRDDQPSYAISGGVTFGGLVNAVEAALVAPFLQRGYTVTVPDTQGQDANFAAGPEYGMNTLDAIRATYATPEAGIDEDTKTGLIGYSGGAIATEWAAELAPGYAPELDARLIGAAMGGVLVHPAHNLTYIDGSRFWAGVLPMAVIGIARSFDIDLEPYLSDYGLRLYNKLRKASIANVLGQYPGLTWKKMAKPEYGTPEEVPIYVETVNKIIMGTGGTPTMPLFIGQGAKGELEGTKGTSAVGKGDGVMVAGDVRSLARQYCDADVTVQYQEYKYDSHITATAKWIPAATRWVLKRFAGEAAPENCDDIAPGNSLAPVVAPAG